MKIAFSLALAFVLSLMCFPSVCGFASSKAEDLLPTAAATQIGLEWHQWGSTYYTEFGEFPQTYVGGTFNNELNYAYSKKYRGHDLTVDINREEIITLNSTHRFEVVTYKGEKYARYEVVYISEEMTEEMTKVKFSNGENMNRGGIFWFKFEPVRWISLGSGDPNTFADGTEVPVVCGSAILSQIPYFISDGLAAEQSGIYGSQWHKSNLRKVLQETIAPLMGIAQYEGLLIGRTPHGISYYDVIDGKEQSRYCSDFIFPPSTYELNTIRNLAYYQIASPSDLTIALIANNNDIFYCGHLSGYITRTGLDPSKASWTPLVMMASHNTRGDYDGNFPLYSLQSALSSRVLNYGLVPMATLLTHKASSFNLGFDEYVDSLNKPSHIINSGNQVITIFDYEGWKAMHTYSDLGGEIGSSTKPYTIRIMKDIDCLGETLKPITHFCGKFDGGGHSVVNLNIEGEYKTSFSPQTQTLSKVVTGLFQSVETGSTIQNTKFLSLDVSGYTVGGLIGRVIGTGTLTIKGIYLEGKITSNFDESQESLFKQYGTDSQSNNSASALVADAYTYVAWTQGDWYKEYNTIEVEDSHICVNLACHRYDPRTTLPGEVNFIGGGHSSTFVQDETGPHYGGTAETQLSIKNCAFEAKTNDTFSAFGVCKLTAASSTWWEAKNGSVSIDNGYYAGFDPSLWGCYGNLSQGKPLLKRFVAVSKFFSPATTVTSAQLEAGLVANGIKEVKL